MAAAPQAWVTTPSPDHVATSHGPPCALLCSVLLQKAVGLSTPLAPGLPSQHAQRQEAPRCPRYHEHRRHSPVSGPLQLLSPLPGEYLPKPRHRPNLPSPATLLSEALPPGAPVPDSLLSTRTISLLLINLLIPRTLRPPQHRSNSPAWRPWCPTRALRAQMGSAGARPPLGVGEGVGACHPGPAMPSRHCTLCMGSLASSSGDATPRPGHVPENVSDTPASCEMKGSVHWLHRVHDGPAVGPPHSRKTGLCAL